MICKTILHRQVLVDKNRRRNLLVAAGPRHWNSLICSSCFVVHIKFKTMGLHFNLRSTGFKLLIDHWLSQSSELSDRLVINLKMAWF